MPNPDLNAKTRSRRRIQIKNGFLAHYLGLLRYLRAFAFKAFRFLFEPATDGNAVARPAAEYRMQGNRNVLILRRFVQKYVPR